MTFAFEPSACVSSLLTKATRHRREETMTMTAKNKSLRGFLRTRAGELASCAWVGVRDADSDAMWHAQQNAAYWAPLACNRPWTLRELREAALALDARGVWVAKQVAQ